MNDIEENPTNKKSWIQIAIGTLLLFLPWVLIPNSPKLRTTLLLHMDSIGAIIYMVLTFVFLLLGAIIVIKNIHNKIAKVIALILLVPYLGFSSMLFLMGMQI